MKILIYDCCPVYREGFRRILGQLNGENLIKEAGDDKEVLILCNKEIFDVLIIHISLPEGNSLEVLQLIKERWPSTNVLVLNMHPVGHYAAQALKLGASGYLTKNASLEELLLAVKRVSSGGIYISDTNKENFIKALEDDNCQKHDTLSEREFVIMIKLAKGKSLKEIGEKLFISSKTVSTYRKRLMAKMSLSSNTDLARYCLENQLY